MGSPHRGGIATRCKVRDVPQDGENQAVPGTASVSLSGHQQKHQSPLSLSCACEEFGQSEQKHFKSAERKAPCAMGMCPQSVLLLPGAALR